VRPRDASGERLAPLRRAPPDEVEAQKRGFLEALSGERRVVPDAWAVPLEVRIRWLRGYDAGVYLLRRSRTNQAPPGGPID
jgi:hypothetical protein